MAIFRLGTKVWYRGQYETKVIGIEAIDGLQEFIMIHIPNYMEKLFNAKDLETVLTPADYGGESQIDPQYSGQKGYWLDRNQFKYLELNPPPKPAPKQDGCACIRCTKFCQMAENNLGNTAELSDPEIKPSAVKKAFGCFSCRDTEAWWFAAKGWTFM